MQVHGYNFVFGMWVFVFEKLLRKQGIQEQKIGL